MAVIAANANVIHTGLSSVISSSFIPSSRTAFLSGLLALYIRCADNVDHCVNIVNWFSHFMGFNEFPGLPHRFSPPDVASAGNAPPEELAQYRTHRFPEIAPIVACVRVRTALLPNAQAMDMAICLSNGDCFCVLGLSLGFC